ncbi:ORF326 [White spot syndrome virus]|uniref:ORF326 n=1 Tax=White spot syndrome virus TaxID=342409 RepID=A0A2D3I5V9_9VIRU|nr:ORF326 [White spot syndrome virus]
MTPLQQQTIFSCKIGTLLIYLESASFLPLFITFSVLMCLWCIEETASILTLQTTNSSAIMNVTELKKLLPHKRSTPRKHLRILQKLK